MAHIAVRDGSIEFDTPTVVEGLPGVGLVGKIAADHLVEEFDMVHYADVVCEGLPELAVYQEADRTVRPPVRLHAAPDRDLLVLQSDVPVSPRAAGDFAACTIGWFADRDAEPVFLSGRPAEKDAAPPALHGVATGDAGPRLDAIGVDSPAEGGAIGGPTGALLHRAGREGLGAVGLIVESDPQFPDPEAANVLIGEAIEPLADITVDTSDLVDRAEEIREQKERLAKRMQEAEEESSRAQPLRMYQ